MQPLWGSAELGGEAAGAPASADSSASPPGGGAAAAGDPRRRKEAEEGRGSKGRSRVSPCAPRWPPAGRHTGTRSLGPSPTCPSRFPKRLRPSFLSENAPPDPTPGRQPAEMSLLFFSLQWLILGREEISLFPSRRLPTAPFSPISSLRSAGYYLCSVCIWGGGVAMVCPDLGI